MAKPLKKNRPFAENIADVIEKKIQESNVRRAIRATVQVPDCFVPRVVSELQAGRTGELLIPLVRTGAGCDNIEPDNRCTCQEIATVSVKVEKRGDYFAFWLLGWRYSEHFCRVS